MICLHTITRSLPICRRADRERWREGFKRPKSPSETGSHSRSSAQIERGTFIGCIRVANWTALSPSPTPTLFFWFIFDETIFTNLISASSIKTVFELAHCESLILDTNCRCSETWKRWKHFSEDEPPESCWVKSFKSGPLVSCVYID